MKRVVLVLLACVILLLCLPLQALAAIVFDGNVNTSEWRDYDDSMLSWAPLHGCITNATLRYALQTGQMQVVFGFTAISQDIEPEARFGAVFYVNGNEIARWQNGDEDVKDDMYPYKGRAYIPPNAGNTYCTYEIALGYTSDAALAALRGLSVALIDPQGIASEQVPYPIVIAEPVTTTKAPTTEKTTTTKAPTTEKTTTTKAPTTEKTTTTKAPTTEKTTTTKEPTTEKTTTTTRPTTFPPTYTTAPPVYTTAREVFSYTPAPLTTRAPVVPKAATTAQVATQAAPATQPATSRTEVIYYTVVYTDTPNTPIAPSQPGAPDVAAFGLENLWTTAPLPTEASQPQSVPTLALPAPQPTRTASPSAALLFSAGGVLVLLAAGLIVLWLHTQKKPTEEPVPEPPDCST